MNLKRYCFAFLILGFYSSIAQTSINTAGGNSSGASGSISYSVGQLATSTLTDGNTSLSEGVQQTFDISVIYQIDEAADIDLSISTYPNPTTNYLIIKSESYESANLRYYIYDINGKTIHNIVPKGKETNLNTEQLTPGTYFVKVSSAKKEIKTFQVIKY